MAAAGHPSTFDAIQEAFQCFPEPLALAGAGGNILRASEAWAQEAGRSVLRMAWQEAYVCGEATIDAKHRELFALLARERP